jgi:hypothetical protein
MSHNFTVHRILCSTPPELAAEQTQFLDSLAQFAEEITTPDRVLFPAATFRAPFDALGQKHAVEGNIRTCEFFIQIFGEQPAEPVYGAFLEYAIQCAADPVQTMRQVAVLFKDAGVASTGGAGDTGGTGDTGGQEKRCDPCAMPCRNVAP